MVPGTPATGHGRNTIKTEQVRSTRSPGPRPVSHCVPAGLKRARVQDRSVLLDNASGSRSARDARATVYDVSTGLALLAEDSEGAHAADRRARRDFDDRYKDVAARGPP